MQKHRFVILSLLLLALGEGAILLWQNLYWSELPRRLASRITNQEGSVAAAMPALFAYTFNAPGILPEAGSMDESWSPYWWLNSGGLFTIEGGVGKTVQGELANLSKWRLAYSRSNPRDTDNGYHPQNIFRLVSRGSRGNVWQEGYFRITKSNVSQSENRNASNGLLLMSRYQDSDTLYYLGIRVDGAAVIKKKIHGDYFTLGYKKIFTGSYDRTNSPNLLPLNKWVGLRSEIKNNSDGSVSLRLLMNQDGRGWQETLAATDVPGRNGGETISENGFNGVRTDFMDVEFKNFKIGNL